MQKKSAHAAATAPMTMPGMKPAANEVPEKPGVDEAGVASAAFDTPAVGEPEIAVAPCSDVGVATDPGGAVREVFWALAEELDEDAASAVLIIIHASPFWQE